MRLPEAVECLAEQSVTIYLDSRVTIYISLQCNSTKSEMALAATEENLQNN